MKECWTMIALYTLMMKFTLYHQRHLWTQPSPIESVWIVDIALINYHKYNSSCILRCN